MEAMRRLGLTLSFVIWLLLTVRVLGIALEVWR